MTTVEAWRAFLSKWSEEWVGVDRSLPAGVRQAQWLGFKPATEEQIARVEKRLGYRLPPSYRAFLLTSNGWRKTTPMVERVRGVGKVEWLEVEDPQMLDICAQDEGRGDFDGLSRAEYFSYEAGARMAYEREHLRKCLKVSDPVAGDTIMYLLNPEVVAGNGEWEAWVDAHWIPGVERYPSFAELMRAEYANFRAVELGDKSALPEGPYEGAYAPSAARGKAERVGAGRRRPRRLSVGELIGLLEGPSAKVRVKAAKELFKEYKPHGWEAERPEWVGPLGRVLREGKEVEVRCAAAMMLGSYGDVGAIEPLAGAVGDQSMEVAGAAVSALHYLSIEMKDARIADAMYVYLGRPGNEAEAGMAMHVMEDLGDRRVAEVGLRMLGRELRNDQLYYQAAFAVARFGEGAVETLVGLLKAAGKAEVRAAAAAGLREAKVRAKAVARALGPLKEAMERDADESVRMQAATSVRFLEAEPVEVDPVDVEEGRRMLEEYMRKMGMRLPGEED